MENQAHALSNTKFKNRPIQMKMILLLACLMYSVSAHANSSEGLEKYFNENKIGHSADYGVFKDDTDYIISIHGLDHDLPVCLEIAAMLNKKRPNTNTYSCKPLNH